MENPPQSSDPNYIEKQERSVTRFTHCLPVRASVPNIRGRSGDAKAFVFTVPSALLARADEVIE
jgi:hypothetical protein